MEKITEDEAIGVKQESITFPVSESSSSVKSLAAALSMQFTSGGLLGGSSVSSQNSSVTSTTVSTADVSI